MIKLFNHSKKYFSNRLELSISRGCYRKKDYTYFGHYLFIKFFKKRYDIFVKDRW